MSDSNLPMNLAGCPHKATSDCSLPWGHKGPCSSKTEDILRRELVEARAENESLQTAHELAYQIAHSMTDELAKAQDLLHSCANEFEKMGRHKISETIRTALAGEKRDEQ